MKPMAQTFLRVVVSLAVSALVCGLILHLVTPSEGQWSVAQLVEVLRRVVPGLLVAYVLLTLVQTLLRAWRYRLLLCASGEPEVPGFGHILLVTMARNMFVDLLPARLGELSYLALLTRGYRVSGAACLSSMAISLVFDFVALLAVFAALLAASVARARPEPWMAGVALVLLAVCAAGLVAVFAGVGWFSRVARVVAGRLRLGRFADKVVAFVERLAAVVAETRRRKVAGATLLLSLGVRAGKYAGFFFAFMAVAAGSFATMAEATPGQVLSSLLAAEGAASVPVPTFMSFGAYEAGGAAAWSWLGFSAGDAALCMFAVHVCSQAVDYSLGAVGMVLLTLFGLGRAPAVAVSRAPRLRRAWVATALFLAAGAAVFLVLEQRRLLKVGALQPPPPGHEVSPLDTAFLAGVPEGFLVWSSNRGGNHDIWRMELPGGRVSQVTKHPHAETYPRISPDGKRIAFARAKAPWVSQRDELNWNVYVADAAGGGEELVAEGATAPSWSGEGRVSFEHGGTQVVEKVLGTGEETVLCASGRGNIPGGTRLQTPNVNPRDGKVAVTLRVAARMTAVVDIRSNEASKVGKGCQLAWAPDYSFLYAVWGGGRMHNRIFRIDPATLAQTPWLDMPEPYSREYFPKLSPDGRWLVFGAAAKGREHDTADYEIFLWEVGSPPASARRMTWHTGNDCWPDLWMRGP